ncbi:MAG: response regulator transcription factor [Melioribacteraceae bacterium]|nr:response regulator transcription factor [Melioribacteraceae bacterium]
MKDVIIIEDIKTIRDGLKTLINTSANLHCEYTFGNFEDFLTSSQITQPDIMLMDLNLPGTSGINGIKQIKKMFSDVTVLVLTLYEENESIFDAIMAGAVGYLVKNTPPDKMLQIIYDASEGRVLMNSYLARKTLNYFYKSKNHFDLTETEHLILKKVVEGQSLKAIENSLTIFVPDIKKYFKSIYEKLHLVVNYN